MDFTALIKKSFQISFHNRVLWLFGFLSAGVGSVGMVNPSGISYSFPTGSENAMADPETEMMFHDTQNFFSSLSTDTIIIGSLIIVLILLLLFLVGIFVVNWSGAALVSSILDREKNRPTLGSGSRAGLKYWWKFWLLTALFSTIVLVVVAMIAVPVVLLFFSSMQGLAIVALVIAILTLIIFIFIVSVVGSLIITLAQRLIVHKGKGVLESVRVAGWLVKRNIGESFLTYLLAAGLSFAASFAGIVIFLPMAAVVFVAFILNAYLGAFMLIPALAILFTAAGFWGAYQATYWTLFYEHLAAKERL